MAGFAGLGVPAEPAAAAAAASPEWGRQHQTWTVCVVSESWWRNGQQLERPHAGQLVAPALSKNHAHAQSQHQVVQAGLRELRAHCLPGRPWTHLEQEWVDGRMGVQPIELELLAGQQSSGDAAVRCWPASGLAAGRVGWPCLG